MNQENIKQVMLLKISAKILSAKTCIFYRLSVEKDLQYFIVPYYSHNWLIFKKARKQLLQNYNVIEKTTNMIRLNASVRHSAQEYQMSTKIVNLKTFMGYYC